MNLIFLDIDGVLNSMPYCELQKGKTGHHEISDFHVKMLSKIYHSCHASIVLASTWRYLRNTTENEAKIMYQYLIDTLAKYGMQIMSHTPVIFGNRPLEIATYLQNIDTNNINYIILDDDFSKEEYKKYGLEKNLIPTKFFCYDISEGGLQPEHVEKAINFFQKITK